MIPDETTNPQMMVQQPPPGPGGIWLPTPVVVTLALAIAGVTAAYIFATKAELAAQTREAGQRITVVEGTVGVHGDSIGELKADIKEERVAVGAVDTNLRTLLIEQGIPRRQIVTTPAPP